MMLQAKLAHRCPHLDNVGIADHLDDHDMVVGLHQPHAQAHLHCVQQQRLACKWQQQDALF